MKKGYNSYWNSDHLPTYEESKIKMEKDYEEQFNELIAKIQGGSLKNEDKKALLLKMKFTLETELFF